jgi:hypothetical protein
MNCIYAYYCTCVLELVFIYMGGSLDSPCLDAELGGPIWNSVGHVVL